MFSSSAGNESLLEPSGPSTQDTGKAIVHSKKLKIIQRTWNILWKCCLKAGLFGDVAKPSPPSNEPIMHFMNCPAMQ